MEQRNYLLNEKDHIYIILQVIAIQQNASDTHLFVNNTLDNLTRTDRIPRHL